jgi:hypothetical protein
MFHVRDSADAKSLIAMQQTEELSCTLGKLAPIASVWST